MPSFLSVVTLGRPVPSVVAPAVIPIAWVAFSLMYCVAYVALPPERPHAQELQSPREIFANKTDLSDL